MNDTGYRVIAKQATNPDVQLYVPGDHVMLYASKVDNHPEPLFTVALASSDAFHGQQYFFNEEAARECFDLRVASSSPRLGVYHIEEFFFNDEHREASIRTH